MASVKRLIQNGESLVYVKDQLGHHSIKVTVDVYGHLVPGANKAAVDRLDQTAVLPEDWRERLAAPVEPVEGRRRTAPPRHQRTAERTRGVTARAVTPREELVELRGLEPLTPRLPERAEDDKLSKDKKRRSAKRGKK